MNWNSLLSEERLGKKINSAFEKPSGEHKFKRSAFEIDYWRIINSASFRRLQDKTQVFPLDKSDFVRTRLTHSLETSSLAKQLTAMITSSLLSIKIYNKYKNHPIDEEQSVYASDISMCAGLLHDIGNPPFGHFGEEVIREWFVNNLDNSRYEYKGQKMKDLFTEQMINDLKTFEGNAQALRLLTKLHHIDSEEGLNLTVSVLNVIVKYPVNSLQINDDKNSDIKTHKLGYYFPEEKNFDQIASYTCTKNNNQYYRHPLTFILEASDDIAYGTADLEDGYKKGFFSIAEFKSFFNESIEKLFDNEEISEDKYNKSQKLIETLEEYEIKYKDTENSNELVFQNWVSDVRDWLLYCAAYGFTHNYEAIMEGTFTTEILEDSFHAGTIKVLKDAMNHFVFNSREIVKLELAAESILNSLLDKLIYAIIYYDEPKDNNKKYKQSKAQKKITTLISQNYKEQYLKSKTEDPTYNLYLRILLITDFISGMTDSYAKNLYQELCGIY